MPSTGFGETSCRKTLLDQHWSGKAATNYHDLIESVWEPALMLAETTAQFIAIGFEKFAEAIIKIAVAACNAIDVIVKSIAKLAKKASPWGAAVGLIEWIASGFEDFPYWAEVNAIKQAIERVNAMYRHVREMVSHFQKYLAAAEGFLDAASRIPEVNSGSDLFYIAKKVTTGTRSIKKTQEEGKEMRERHKVEREKILKKGQAAEAGTG